MIGKQIGRYRLTEEIGRGGMGIVYKATQVTLNRTVAVKMLPHDLASSGEYLARFAREAETLASLQHPNIVHIYDVEEVDGNHFIIMEYVGGPPLTKRLQAQGRLDPREVRSISVALASALEAAHRKEIIHRDIKPDNILFSEDGTPKLTDFGIARMRDSNVKTQTGVMLGTPYYMSPEQVSGATVVAASDVYSLGVVMYEMLSGRVPFTADTPVAVALKHLQEAATPIGRLVPTVPPDLGAIVDRAMAKDVATRFDSATSIESALTRLDLDVSHAAAPITECPRCGASLQVGFRACPSCALSLDGLGEIGTPDEPLPGESGTDAVAAARKAAGTAREVADSGLDHLAGAGAAVADSAGALWSAASRSAEAVWSAVSGDGADDGPGTTDDGPGTTDDGPGTTDDGPGTTAEETLTSGTQTPGLEAPSAWRTRASRVSPLMWAGLVLVAAGVLTAAGLALSASTGGPSREVTQLPPAPPPGSTSSGRSSTFPPVAPPRDQIVAPGGAGPEPGTTDPENTSEPETPDSGTNPPPPPPPADEPAEEEVEAAPTDAGGPGGADEESGRADEGVGKTVEPEKTTATAVTPTRPDLTPGFDEVSARQQIRGIVERQRRATEDNDETLYLLDMDRDARSVDGRNDRNGAARVLRDLHDDFSAVRSVVTDLRVTFSGTLHATAHYHARLSAVPKGQTERRPLVDADFSYELEFKRGRWLIVSF